MKLWLALFATSLFIPLSAAHGMACLQAERMQAEKTAEPTQTASQKSAGQQASDDADKNEPTSDRLIYFTFQDPPWSQVIPWFAEQAEFGLQNVESFPNGTFNLKDSGGYTKLGALDALNRSLAGLEVPYTLIRNRNLLTLKPTKEAIKKELLDAVKPEDLDGRGLFELLSVTFDLGDLDGVRLFEDLKRSQVSKDYIPYFHFIESSNQLQVRETGARLRDIRSIVETAKKRLAAQQVKTIEYNLKFQDADTFIPVVGAQLGIPEGKKSDKDGTITIVSEPLSPRLFISGTQQMLDRFASIAKIVDSDPNAPTESLTQERPYLVSYPITIDPKLAYDLLSTMLEGSDSRMQQDEGSGAITVLGRKEDHDRVVESLASVENVKTKNFDIITLEKLPVAEALGYLQQFYGSTTSLTEETNNGPKFSGNSLLNQVMVFGTPKEVSEVRSMLVQLDEEHLPAMTGPRSTHRIIEMPIEDQMRLMPALNDLLGTVNVKNPFTVVRPSQRKAMIDQIRRGGSQDTMDKSYEERFDEMIEDIPSAGRSRSPRAIPQSKLQKKPASAWQEMSALAMLAVGAQRVNLVSSLVLIQQEGRMQTRNTTSGNSGAGRERESIPGAPIQFRFNDYGLTIESEDLDAADDIELAIQEFLGKSTALQNDQFFELQHRDVTEMQQILESILGLSDAGGGADAGGNPLGGMMSNLIPGGDLFEGILDGVSGPETDAGVEGDVRFVAETRFNVLVVIGATGNDLTRITQLIDYWDRPEGQTKLKLFGATRMIKVKHRDVLEIVEIIEKQFPGIIYNDQAKQGNQANNGEVAQMLKAVQQLGGKGGGGGGGGGAASNGKKQTVVLGADTANNTIFVTGPEYLFQDILSIVKSSDVAPPPVVTSVVTDVANQDLVVDAVIAQFQGQVKRAGPVDEASTNGNEKVQDGNKDQQSRAAAERAQVQQLRQLERQGNQQGGGRNANGGGGRGNAGGGGRGNTGGGGGGRGNTGGGGRGTTGGGGRGTTGGGGGRGTTGGGGGGGRGNTGGGGGGGGGGRGGR